MEKYIVGKEIFDALEKVTSFIPTPIYWEDVNSIIVGANKHVLTAVGLQSLDDYVGKSLYDLYPKEMADNIKLHNEQVMHTGEVSSQEEVIADITTGEFKYYTAIKAPLYDTNGTIIGVIGTSVNISELKKTQAELIAAKQKAESASHAKTEFIANMSHDIRTPLSGVVGLAAILESQLTDPLHKKEAHDLGQSGNALLDMLNEILDVIAADNVNTNDIHEGAFNLFDLIHGIINLEQPSVAVKKIQLHSKIDPDIPLVLISDYKKIHHILLNLVGNAIKFTTEGQVDINVTILHRQTEQLTLEFQVIDTGKGIPTEALDNVFDPFFRVTPSYKGLDKGHGLGLHIAQTYVQLLGGKIHVISKLNEGSVFSFTLPIKIGDQSKVSVSSPDAALPPSQPVSEALPSPLTAIPANELSSNAPKILIIEDNPVALMVADTLIKNAHLTTATAVDGETALELSKKQTFDLIVSDVGLPGISGIDFARQFRAYETERLLKPVPIVGLTAHAEEQVRQECLEAGMNDVLIKPITAEMVNTIVTQFSLGVQTLSNQASETSATLGLDLPNTEAELFELDKLPLLDAELAIKELGNNKALLITMLQSFLEELPKETASIQTAYATKDWAQVEKLAHKMKGGTVYLKLNKLSTACQYLERYHKAGHSKLLESLYQQMMVVMKETEGVVGQYLQK